MSKKIWIPVLAAVLVASALFLAAGAYRVVSAAGLEGRWGDRGLGVGGPGGEALAEALGISVDDLNAAYQKASEAAVQQALDQGLVTQEQAEQLRSGGRFGRGMHLGGRMLGSSAIDFHALLADALGITPEQLTAAMQQAHEAQLAQAVADGRITQEQADLMQARQRLHLSESFQSSMRSAYEAAVNRAVQEGVITQEQADQILSGENGFGMRGFGMGGRGMGGFGMRGAGNCPGAAGQ